MGQIVIEHLHGASTRVRPTEAGYALRHTGFNVMALSQWMTPSDDAACTAWARDSHAALAPFAGPIRYLNYPDRDDVGDRMLETAHGPNVHRLQSIKATYDLDSVFHLNVNTPPRA